MDIIARKKYPSKQVTRRMKIMCSQKILTIWTLVYIFLGRVAGALVQSYHLPFSCQRFDFLR